MEKEIYEKKALEVAQLVFEKNQAYGDSLSAMAQILELLYGESIPKEKYEELHYIIRILDKISRVTSGHKDAFEEDPFKDIMGYSLNKLAHLQSDFEYGIIKYLTQISFTNPAQWKGMTEKNEPIVIDYRNGVLKIWIGKITETVGEAIDEKNRIFSKQIGNTSEMTTTQLLFWLEKYNLFETQND